MNFLYRNDKLLVQRRRDAEPIAICIDFAPLRLCVSLLALAIPSGLNAAEVSSKPLEVQSVVLRLINEAEVPAQEAGVLTDVPAREGQVVKKGDLLAQIDDRVPRMAEQAARLAVEVARAKATNDVNVRFAAKAAEVAQAELRRSTESIERFANSVSQSQVDVEQLTVDKTKLEAEQARFDLEIAELESKSKQNEMAAARTQLERRRIVAPIDGQIVQVFVRLGEWVEPGQKALRIVNINRLKAEGFLPADVAVAELRGAPVRLTIDAGGESNAAFAGTIAFVSPEVDPITGQVRVWAAIDNRAGSLRPGQSVRMVIDRNESVVSSQ